VPVLMYHQILDEAPSQLSNPYQVALASFVEQLHFLKQNGNATVSLDDLLSSRTLHHSTFAAKRVALTFDDGYIDNYLYAYPALRQLGMTATFFVIINKIASPGFMTWEHLREMQAQGMSIQSHTLNHCALATLSTQAIMVEVEGARQRLENALQKKVEAISFPHGSYDGRVLRAVQASGYRACCTSDFGYYNPKRATTRMPRIIVRNHHGLEYFSSIVCRRGSQVLRLRAGAAARRALMRTLGFRLYQSLYEQVYRRNHAIGL